MSEAQQIIFVYKAQSGFMHSMADLFTKATKPSEYPCKLCSLTYNGAFMKKMWKEYVASLKIKTVFMHKDEFSKAYPASRSSFPAILLASGNELTPLINSTDFERMNDLTDLMKMLNERLRDASGQNNLYQCPECGLHYTDEATAKKCAAWCCKYKSCNLEITKLSIEAQENKYAGY